LPFGCRGHNSGEPSHQKEAIVSETPQQQDRPESGEHDDSDTEGEESHSQQSEESRQSKVGHQTGEPGDASQREPGAGTQTGPGVGSQQPGYDNPDEEHSPEQGHLSEQANEQAREEENKQARGEDNEPAR
jgi:hypothetical protein